MKNNLYKQLYTIAVYSKKSEGETLLALCESTAEFADYLKTTLNTARSILSKCYKGKSKHIIVSGRYVTVEFLEL